MFQFSMAEIQESEKAFKNVVELGRMIAGTNS